MSDTLRKTAEGLDNQIKQADKGIAELNEKKHILVLQRRGLDEALAKLPPEKSEVKSAQAKAPSK